MTNDHPDRVQQVLALHAAGLLQREIAARVGLSRSRVSQIVRRAGLRSPRGFAAIPPDERRRLGSLGGKAAQATGTAHRFSHEEAVAAGAKGGQRSHQTGRGHRFTTEEARAAGRKGLRAQRGKKGK
jgi:hypothetical protein